MSCVMSCAAPQSADETTKSSSATSSRSLRPCRSPSLPHTGVVAAAASTPLWGKLGDRYGRKLLLEVALVVFVATSALCGAAQDITQLIALRAVQGAAAGGLMTLAMASVGDLVVPRERGRYQGYIAATFAVATIVGPLIGGVLVDHASWRWVFLVNLPLGAVALAGLTCACLRRRPRAPTDRSTWRAPCSWAARPPP